MAAATRLPRRSGTDAPRRSRFRQTVKRGVKKTGSSFGVSLDQRGLSKPYKARVRRGGKMVGLGSFATTEEAALCVARTPEGRAAATLCVVGYDVSLSHRGGTQPTAMPPAFSLSLGSLSAPTDIRRSVVTLPRRRRLGASYLPNLRCLYLLQLSITDLCPVPRPWSLSRHAARCRIALPGVRCARGWTRD